MSSVQEPHLHLEVGHILFLDIVGYSKLLADEQKELVQELNQIVRETEQFRAAEAEGKLRVYRRAMGWCSSLQTIRKRPWNARWKSARRYKATRNLKYAWAFTVARSIHSRM